MKNLWLLFFMLSVIDLSAQEKAVSEPLYTGEIPFSKVSSDALGEFGFPYFYPFVLDPSVSKDIVFLVIPGGGYARVAIGHEGLDVARRLNGAGFSAYVLFYRVPVDSLMTNKKFVPLQDATTMLEITRERHPGKKVAVIGFSAGGHLAATLSNFPKNAKVNIRNGKAPKVDYSILGYPVISMEDGVTHKGSKKNLIGTDVVQEEVGAFSMEKQVTSDTPPTFIMHAKDDKAVPIENADRYISALKEHRVPFESYIYEKGGHGFGLVNKQEDGDWFGKMLEWVQSSAPQL